MVQVSQVRTRLCEAELRLMVREVPALCRAVMAQVRIALAGL